MTYLRFHIQGWTYQFKALPFSLSTAPMESTVLVKEVKLMAIQTGIKIHQYLKDWLVRARSHRACLQHTQELGKMCQELGWLVNLEKSGLQLHRVPVRPQMWPGQAHSGPVADPPKENTGPDLLTGLSGSAVHVFDRSANSHRETSLPWPATHETNSMTPQKQLEASGITRKGHSNPHVLAAPPEVVASRRQCTSGPTNTPTKICSVDFYRHIRRRMGHSLRRAHCKRNLVLSRKQAAYKLFGAKSSLFSLKRVPRPLLRQDSSCSNRQHHSGVIHKQGRRHEVGSALCPTAKNLDLVHQEISDSQNPTHSRPAERGSRQAIKAGPDHRDRVVSPSRGFPNNLQQVPLASNRSICHKIQQQVTSVCVTGTGSPGLSSGCTQPTMGGSGCICLPTSSHLGQSGGEIALVLGSSGHVHPNPTEPAKSAQPVDTALQSDPSQKYDKPKSPCMAPRSSAIKEQGFSEAMAARIEAPQRGSTRSVYEAKWTILTKWCLTN